MGYADSYPTYNSTYNYPWTCKWEEADEDHEELPGGIHEPPATAERVCTTGTDCQAGIAGLPIKP